MYALIIPLYILGLIFTLVFHLLFLKNKTISKKNKKIGKIISYVSYGIFAFAVIDGFLNPGCNSWLQDLFGNVPHTFSMFASILISILLVGFFIYSLIKK